MALFQRIVLASWRRLYRLLRWLEAYSNRSVQRSRVWRYGFALVVSSAFLVLRIRLGSLLEPSPFVLANGAVFTASWFGGFGPGLLAIILFILSHIYFFVSPRGAENFSHLQQSDWVALGAFVVISTVINSLLTLRRAASQHHQMAAQEAFHHLKEVDAILESALDSIIVMDRDGKVVRFNQAAERMFGYSEEEAVGREMASLIIPPELRDQHRAGLKKYLDTGEQKILGRRIEMTATRADGTLFPVELAVSSTQLGANSFFTGYVRDISERKKSEEFQRFMVHAGTVLNSTLDYQSTLQNIAKLAVPTMGDWCVVSLLDDNGQLERVAVNHANPAKVRLVDEIDRRWPSRPGLRYGTLHVIKTGQSQLIPEVTEEMIQLANPDPAYHHAVKQLGLKSALTVPLKVAENIIGAISLVYGESNQRYSKSELVTAEILAARAGRAIENAQLYQRLRQVAVDLKKHRDQLEVILEGVADGITVQDQSGKLIYANEAAARMIGYPDGEEVLKSDINQLLARFEMLDEEGNPFPPDQLPGRRALAGEANPVALVRFRALPSGEERVSLVKARPIYGPNQQVTLAVNILQDITQRYRMEKQKDEFVQIASHELKTPLTSMKIFAQSVHRLAQQRGASGRELEGLEVIERQVDRLNRLVANMLEVTKLDSGQVATDYGESDLGELIEDVVHHMSAVVYRHELIFENGESAKALLSPTQIEQVLVNLITNAAQHSSHGTPIKIVLRLKQNEAVISVGDQGEGIPEEKQERLFERFYQVDARRSRGVGLGLYICRQIIKQHRGRIWVKSEPGKGSTFSFALPLKQIPSEVGMGSE